MSTTEGRILAELRRLRAAEAALLASYEKLLASGTQAGLSFVASLKSLDERLNQFETFLERIA